MLVPAVFAVLMKMNLNLWDRIIDKSLERGYPKVCTSNLPMPAVFGKLRNDRRVMISFQKRFLFVHIPKTAGNSIQSVLRDYSEDELVALRREQDGVERFGLRNPKYKIKKHSTLQEYRLALGKEKFGELYKFAC